MSICIQCRFRNSPGRRSCVKCGSVLGSRGGSGGKLIFSVLVLLLAVGAVAFVATQKSTPAPAAPDPQQKFHENPPPVAAAPQPPPAAPPGRKKWTRPAGGDAPKAPNLGPGAKPVPPAEPKLGGAGKNSVPKSQFDQMLGQAADYLNKKEYRQAYNWYLAAEGFQKLPPDAGKKKDLAWAMWSLKEVVRDLSLRSEFDPAWARLTRDRLAGLDYNTFPSEADKKEYLDTMKKLAALSAGKKPGGSR